MSTPVMQLVATRQIVANCLHQTWLVLSSRSMTRWGRFQTPLTTSLPPKRTFVSVSMAAKLVGVTKTRSKAPKYLTAGLKKNTRTIEQLTSAVALRPKKIPPSIWDLEPDGIYKGHLNSEATETTQTDSERRLGYKSYLLNSGWTVFRGNWS